MTIKNISVEIETKNGGRWQIDLSERLFYELSKSKIGSEITSFVEGYECCLKAETNLIDDEEEKNKEE